MPQDGCGRIQPAPVTFGVEGSAAPPPHRMSARFRMRPPTIALFDFNPLAAVAGALMTPLAALGQPVATVLHESLEDHDMAAAIEALTTTVFRTQPDVVILAFTASAQRAADDVFARLLARNSAPPVVVVPCAEDPDVISALLDRGASDYLLPPFRLSDVQPRLRRLLAPRPGPPASAAGTANGGPGLGEFIGESPALLEQIRKIPRIARSDACVLIAGETGTGKELCARAVHYSSPRASCPFVPLNCGAVPVDLLENELFGHAAGAFTSANGSQGGVIREADGGSLFLDEVDALPLSAQVKLLRFLQDKHYRPLGGGKLSKANVRVIAASNHDLAQLLRDGRLRPDLFYRLNVLSLHLPSLRSRREDIPLLAAHFAAKHAAELGMAARPYSPAALHKLRLHDWPGNVRELENVVERAVILGEGPCIEGRDLDLPETPSPAGEPVSFGRRKAQLVADFEASYLRDLLERHRGNITQAAHAAQKNRRVFFQLMRKHHLRVLRFPAPETGQPLANVVIQVDNKVLPPSPRSGTLPPHEPRRAPGQKEPPPPPEPA